MSLVAPNTDHTVVPTPVRRQGSVWTALGGLAGFLADHLDLLPIPPAYSRWLPVVGLLLGWLAHQILGPDEYQPVPPQKAAPMPPELSRLTDDQWARLLDLLAPPKAPAP